MTAGRVVITAWDVSCPSCDARPGTPCSNKPLGKFHVARRRAASEAFVRASRRPGAPKDS